MHKHLTWLKLHFRINKLVNPKADIMLQRSHLATGAKPYEQITKLMKGHTNRLTF